jgi:hypothetical protein
MTAVLRAIGFAALLLTCVGVAPAQALTQAEKTVFYSGTNHDGENSGKDAGAWVMVETPFKDYEVWKGTTKCNSNRAVPRKPQRTFTRLVGYSLGRLGPAYYLQQKEQQKVKSDIREVLLLDPGIADEFECDNKSGAGYTYATWLRQNSSNRLVIITGGRSDDETDKYKGLRETYLNKLTAQTVGSNVGDRVLVCDAPSIKHSRVDEAWKHLIGVSSLPKSCPAATTLSKYSPKSEPGAIPPVNPPNAPNPGTGTGASPRVTLGQGPAAPSGYRYAVSISAFAAGASVTIVCRDSVDPGGFFSFVITADGAGNGAVSNQCYSGDGPDHWVTANGIESNHVAWGSGAGPAPPPPPPSSAQVIVDNRVTNGASAMREDTPAYLSTMTRNFCKRDGCALSGTDMGSGSVITAECTTIGNRTTNGQDNSAIDDGNPGLYTSSRWYGIRWGDGRFGFISEVWIAAAYRGGLGLRGC